MPPVISSVLPEDFDGSFYFTNFSQEEFIGRWGGIDYKFPPEKTTKMIMNFSPAEIQQIRKKFARDLAEHEFFKNDKYKALDSKNVGVNFHSAVTYAGKDLEELIQKCLIPLPTGKLIAEVSPKENRPEASASVKILKSKLSGDDSDESLIRDGTVITE